MCVRCSEYGDFVTDNERIVAVTCECPFVSVVVVVAVDSGRMCQPVGLRCSRRSLCEQGGAKRTLKE